MCIRSNVSSKGKEKNQILQIKNNNLPIPPAGIRKIHVNVDIFYLLILTPRQSEPLAIDIEIFWLASMGFPVEVVS